MKFQYLAQLLVDSNCLLLILKMFGIQEATFQVRARHDVPVFKCVASHCARLTISFFRYCCESGSRDPAPLPRPEDAMLAVPPRPGAASPNSPVAPLSSTGAGDDEVELLTDYSARNFFAIINFLHILQKLTKRKVHRVLLLSQYKSSAILKRMLKVSHPLMQVYTLKIIKSQIPYCGRKWRQCALASYGCADRFSQHEGHHGHLSALPAGPARRVADGRRRRC